MTGIPQYYYKNWACIAYGNESIDKLQKGEAELARERSQHALAHAREPYEGAAQMQQSTKCLVAYNTGTYARAVQTMRSPPYEYRAGQ